MQNVTDALLPLFLALGSAWFAVDLLRKLRQPAASAEPLRSELAAPLPAASPASAPTAPAVLATPAAAPAPAPLAAAASPSPAPAIKPGVPAAHLVAITAAVHHLFKGRARLVSAFAAPALAGASSTHPPVDWAREGRRDIFTSHRVR